MTLAPADRILLAWHTLPCRYPTCLQPVGRRCLSVSGNRVPPHKVRLDDLDVWLSRQPEVDALTADRDHWKGDAGHWEGEYDDAVERLDLVTAGLNKMTALTTTLTAERDQLKADLSEAATNAGLLTDQLKTARLGAALVPGLQQQVADLLAKIAVNEQIISSLRARIDELEHPPAEVVLLDKPAPVRVTFPANKYGGGAGRNVVTKLKAPADEITMTYELLFEKGFEVHKGLKLPGPTGALDGVNPLLATDGRDAKGAAVSGRLMLLDPNAGSWLIPGATTRRRAISPREVVGYGYHINQADKFGDNIWTSFAPPFEEWVTFRLRYKMNAIGQKNGIWEIDLNGGKQVNLTDFEWRSNPNLHWTHAVESLFPGGADMNYTAPFDRFVQLRNLRVTSPAA